MESASSQTPPAANKTSIVHTTMPSNRRRLRPFLIDKLNSGQFKGLRWVDKTRGKFRIPWKHGAKQGWSPEDSSFFKEWARHTGKFVEGVDTPQWSAWKTRIRCAFNKSPDIVEVKAESHTDDRDDPYKVYEFKGLIEEMPVRPDTTRQKSGTNAWLCKLCTTGFPDVESRINHKCKFYNKLVVSRRYVCAKCSYNTETHEEFQRHLQGHVVERNNNTVVSDTEATRCVAEGMSVATNRVAEGMAVDVKLYVCTLCDYSTDDEVEYEQHQHSHVMEADHDTTPESHIQRTVTHDPHVQRTAATHDPHVQRTAATYDSHIQRTAATQDPHVQRTAATHDPHVQRTAATHDPHVQRTAAIHDPHVQRTAATHDPHVQRTAATYDSHIQRTAATHNPHVQRPAATHDPHVQRTAATHDPHVQRTAATHDPHVQRTAATHDSHSDNKKMPRIIVLPKPPADNSQVTTPPIDLSVMSRLSLTNSGDGGGKTEPINLSSSPNAEPRFTKTPPRQLPVNSRYIFANSGQIQDKTRPINLQVNARRAAANEEYTQDKTPPINLRLCAQCDYCTLCGDDLEQHLQQTHNKTVSPKVRLQTKVKADGEKDKLLNHDNQRESKKQKLQDAKETPTNMVVGPSHKYVVEINLPAAPGSIVNAASAVKKDGTKKLISVHDLVEWSSIVKGADSGSKKVLVLQPTINKLKGSPSSINKLMASTPSINNTNASPRAKTKPSPLQSHVDSSPPNLKPYTSKAHIKSSLPNPKPSPSKTHVDPSVSNLKFSASKSDTAARPGSSLLAASATSPGSSRREGAALTTLYGGNIYRVTSKQHSDPDTGSVYCVTTKTPVNGTPGSPGTGNVSQPDIHLTAVTSKMPTNPPTDNVKSVTGKSNSPIVRISPIVSDTLKRPTIELLTTNKSPPPVNVSTVVSRRQQGKVSPVNHNPFFSQRQTMFVDKTMRNLVNKTVQQELRGEANDSCEIENHGTNKMSVLRHRLNDPVSASLATLGTSSTTDPVTSNHHGDPHTTDVPLDLSSKSKGQRDKPSESSTRTGNSSKTGDIETNEPDSSSPEKKTHKERVRHNPNANKQLQRLRPWLTDKLNGGNIKGLYWLNKQKSVFRIPWKHGGKHDWSPEHSQIFKEWAKHTGKFREGADEWAKWKTRIRCAFNKSPEIQEVKELANIGAETLDPYKVYLFKDADQGSPLWLCEECFETFTSAGARDTHRLCHEDVVDIKPYVCPLCEFCTENQDLFYEHQCTHSMGTVEVDPVVLGAYHHVGAGDQYVVAGDHHVGTGDQYVVAGDHDVGTDDHDVVAGDHDVGAGDQYVVAGDHDVGAGDHDVSTGDHDVVTGAHDVGTGDEPAFTGSLLCDLCPYSTENQADFDLHHQTHTIGTIHTLTIKHEDTEYPAEEMAVILSFTCDQCDFSTENQEAYAQHQQAHSMGTTDTYTVREEAEVEECSDEETAVITSYVCDPDAEDMETEDLYNQDQWTLVKENDDSNSTAAGRTESSGDDQEEVVETSDIKLYICEHCGTCMDSQELLEVHQQSHDIGAVVHQQSHVIGTLEPVTISQDSDNNGYLDMLNDVKPYRCENCDYCAINEEDYEHHLKERQLKTMCIRTVVRDSAKIISDSLETEATDVKPHRCEDCDYCTHYKEDFELHLQTHDTRQIISDDDDTETPDPLECYICEVCGKAYKRRHRLDTHLQMHITEEAPACTQCGKTFRTMSTLNNHLKLHTTGQDGAPLACAVCAKEQRDAYILKKHMKVHWTKMSHTCKLCKAVFPHFTTFKIHVKGHAKEGRKECGKGFSDEGRLEVHTKSGSSGSTTTPHECKYCGEHFSDVNTLYFHSKSHMAVPTHQPKTHQPKPVKTSGQFVWNRVGSALTFTKQNEENMEKRVLVCSDCVEGHKQRSALKTHTLTIRDIMYHVCSTCGNRFSKTSDQQVYILPHTGTMDHVCSDCGKGFSQESSLKAHMLTHPAKVEHVCSDCGKGFSQESSLQIHALTHTGSMDHVCSDCGNAYSKESSLKAHMLTHTAMSEYVCSDSGKAFGQESNLKNPALTHTDVKDCAHTTIEYYKCGLCVRGFIHQEHLVDHMDRHTANK